MRKLLFVILVISLVATLVACRSFVTTPTPTPPTPTPAQTPAPSTTTSASNLTNNQSSNNGKTVTVSGQTYLVGSPPKVLLDGTSGVNIIGNTATLQKGFYSLTGMYDAKTNTLNVTNSQKEDVKYQAIETAKSLAGC